jgi:hypothetical protein
MKISTAFPSSYLKHDELNGVDMILTIKSVSVEEIGQGDDKETKPIVYFHETDKGLALNKTNAAIITELYGDETDDWEGKRISLFKDKTNFAGKRVDCIRVRDKVPASASPAAAPRSAPAPAVPAVPMAVPADGDAKGWMIYCYNLWKAKHPEIADKVAQRDQYAAIVTAWFKGVAPTTLTAEDWKSFAQANHGETSDSDEIPF